MTTRRPIATRRSRYSSVPLDVSPIVRLWLLRLLIPLEGHRYFIDQHGFSNDVLAEVLGLGEWIDPPDRAFSPTLVRTELRKLYQVGERKLCNSMVSVCLSNNIARLSTLVGLSETDCRILEFAVLIQSE